jgi:hypothetical protein
MSFSSVPLLFVQSYAVMAIQPVMISQFIGDEVGVLRGSRI